MNIILILPILISFSLVVFMLPFWIRKARAMDLVGKDMNKYHAPEVAEGGGIVVVSSFIIGILIYIAIRTFILKDADGINLQIFSLISSILILAFIGLVDSLLATRSNLKYHEHGWRKGLAKKYRILLCLFAAIPLMVINVGVSTMNIPFFGAVNFGILYALILIPLGIVGATTTYNFLAGFNGLEAGQGIIILSFLSFVAYANGSSWLAIVGLCFVASLIAFFIFNKNPAQVFPSDVLTYPIGGMIAIMAILGNFEKIAFIVFIPYIIEVILKSRGKLKKQSFGIAEKNGNLKMPYEKVYGMTHFAIFVVGKFKKRVTENDVVYFIFAVQILFVLLGFLML